MNKMHRGGYLKDKMPYKDATKKKEYMKKYRIENRERLKILSGNWAINNPEKVKISYKKHYDKNKKEIMRKQKIYVETHENVHEIKKIRRATAHKIPLKSSCEICNSINNLQRHHWRYDKPLLVNTLCKSCHQIQHIKHFNQSKYGGII